MNGNTEKNKLVLCADIHLEEQIGYLRSTVVTHERNFTTVTIPTDNVEVAKAEFFKLIDKIHLQFAVINGQQNKGEENDATSRS